MSYHICYGSEKDLIRFKQRNHHGVILLSFVAALIVGVRLFLPDIFCSYLERFNPLDECGVQAFYTMMDHVRQGIPIGEAVDAFCRSIVGNADIWH